MSTATAPTQPPAKPKPDWLKVKLPAYDERILGMLDTTKALGLATVCQQARCPNLGECWAEGTATLMLMGERCTRHCKFCAVPSGNVAPLDPEEPAKVAQVVKAAGWRYVVLTTVDRDDLPDGGAAHIADTLKAIQQAVPGCLVETLLPDFQGDEAALATVLAARPHVLAHNVETIERLNPVVRDRRANYRQSLRMLEAAKERQPDLLTKSSLMLGLGESECEVRQALGDLRLVGVNLVTLGQYLQPTPRHQPVEAYLTPEQFARYKAIAEQELGFAFCAAGPLVRSSYKAMEAYVEAIY